MQGPFHHRLPLDARVHVAGHRGLVGSAIWRHLEQRGHTDLMGLPSKELDLRDRNSVFQYYEETRPEFVILAAARVGGILANAQYPADFLSDNIRIQVNVLDAAQATGVSRLLFLGSSCIYPKFAEQPIRESSLLTGPLEPTNEAYAIAKIAGVLQVQALRRQYGCSFISAMPTNLYGPGDNFDLHTAHVLPALMRKIHEARADGVDQITLWGTGRPRRDLLYVEDVASAVVTLIESYDDDEPINIGTGEDIEIRDLAQILCDRIGFGGKINWDTTKPDGTPQKKLDVTKLEQLSWRPSLDLDEGIRRTYDWFLKHG